MAKGQGPYTPMTSHPNFDAATGSRGVQHQMEVLQLSVSKRRLISRSTKLHSRSVDNSWWSPGKLHLSSSCNMTTRSPGNLPISNKRNSGLYSSMRSLDNLLLSSRYNCSLCSRRRMPDNLHYTRRTRPGNCSKK
jgi:hypothetical protein